MDFNDSQKQAILHREGPCLVVAGPGSGKTAVITHRVLSLIKSGIPAENILVITFTKAAAIEMMERFNGLSEEKHLVTFGTFHSLFWGILRKELGYKNKDIIMGKQKEQLIKAAMKEAGEDFEDNNMVNIVATEISIFDNSIKDILEYKSDVVDREGFIRIYKAYRDLKNKYRVIDFDDMLLKAYDLFSKNPEVLARWQDRFTYFLIDEMQDMNDLQFRLVLMLSAKTNNVFAVGDDDQSIYGFRGANPKIMRDFVEAFDETKQIVLNHNYRNPAKLVQFSGRLIANNNDRFEKEIISQDKEGIIEIIQSENEVIEATTIAKNIKARSDKGESLESIAILYRNHADAKYVITKLIENQIPMYFKEASTNIYSHFIIEDIETYFQIAIGNGTKARFLRILNRPDRYFHRSCIDGTMDGILRFYSDNGTAYRRAEAMAADIKLLSKMRPVAAISYLMKVVGYEEFLRKEAISNNVEFEGYLEMVAFISDAISDCKNLNQAINKINILRYKVDYENKNKPADKNGRVGLYTLHSSKGLEFDTVYIISVNEGVIPTSKAETKSALEAERRLFYVGITRSKKNLILSYTNKKNRDKSRFLSEMKFDYSSSQSSE